jgi:hypothetical protein
MLSVGFLNLVLKRKPFLGKGENIEHFSLNINTPKLRFPLENDECYAIL